MNNEDQLRDECYRFLHSAEELLLDGYYEYARRDAIDAAKLLTKLKRMVEK